MFPFPQGPTQLSADQIQQMRLRALMQPQGVDSSNAIATPTPTAQDTGAITNPDTAQPIDVPSRMSELYKPNTQAQDAFSGLINRMPQRGAFQPSRMRTIGAALAGLGTGGPTGHWGGNPVGYASNPSAAFDTSQKILNAPYDRAMSDWEAAARPISQAAVQEEQRNREQRMFASSEVQNELRDQAEKDKKDLTQQLRDRQQQDADTRSANAAINEYKAKNPSHKIITTPQGVFGVDPKTNATEAIQVDGKPLESGKVSDTTKMNIQLHNRLAEIEAQTQGGLKKVAATGDEARKTEETKQTGRTSLQDIKARQTKEIEDLKAKHKQELSDVDTTTTVTDAAGKPVATKTTVKKPRIVMPQTNQPSARLTAPDGKVYDTTTWTPKQINDAKAAGYK